jgi:hypothetical protein
MAHGGHDDSTRRPALPLKVRYLTLLILCYVSLDLSSPFVPGAFSFDPDESIEAVLCQPVDAPRRPVRGIRFPRLPPQAEAVTRPAGTVVPIACPSGAREWLVDVRQAHAPLPEVPTGAEDH